MLGLDRWHTRIQRPASVVLSICTACVQHVCVQHGRGGVNIKVAQKQWHSTKEVLDPANVQSRDRRGLKKEVLASFKPPNWQRTTWKARFGFVEKAWFNPRTLGTEAERAANCATRTGRRGLIHLPNSALLHSASPLQANIIICTEENQVEMNVFSMTVVWGLVLG
jgi:hypothetical protein